MRHLPPVSYSTIENIAVLRIDNPPVNALSAHLRVALEAALQTARNDAAVEGIVILCSGETFITGADITEQKSEKAALKPQLRDLQDCLQALPKLTVVAIHGAALGGGLEFALTADARVAVPGASFGLPEVNIGLIPGAGGTLRLPKLVGIEKAVDMITNGKSISVAEALENGVIDEIVDELEQGAVAFARRALSKQRVFTPVIKRNDKVLSYNPEQFAKLKAEVNKRARGRVAPLAALECIEASVNLAPLAALEFEREKFIELRNSEQHAALLHYFFAERSARKVSNMSKDVTARKIDQVAVIGSGTMGGGIAMVFANAGLDVKLVDINQSVLDQGLAKIEKNYQISVDRGSMSQTDMAAALGRIKTHTDYAQLADVDLAIEAVPEDINLKQKVFTGLDAVMKSGAILATNTSSLDIDAIASATSRPEDVIGIHFFSPANVMKLQENVRGKKSSPSTIKTVMELGKRIGKNVVLAGNCDGFIGNRMLQYYTGESEFLLEQGASPEQIDRVAVSFGMPMGPIAMRDMAGIDVGVMVRAPRWEKLQQGDRMSPILERMLAAGRLGMKNGKGFYRYEGRDKFPDQEALNIIASVAREFGIESRTFTDEEIALRLFAPLVNEGAKELEEGIAQRASDIDVVWVNGYGFPAYKGGPMFWGENIVGLRTIYDLAVDAEKRNGPRWGPSRLLERLAKENLGWEDA